MPTAKSTFARQVSTFISRDDEKAASAALGRDHALVRLFALRRALAWQIAVTSVPVLFGIVGTVRQVATAPAVLGSAGLVWLVLVGALRLVGTQMRSCARELIAAGYDELRRPNVIDERRRLASRKERESLARTLERLLHDAQHWHRILPTARPLPGVHALRFMPAEVHEVVVLLRADPVRVRGVALTVELLTDGGSSPLFQGDAEKLRAELNRIRDLLVAPSPTAHSAPEHLLAA